MRSVFQFAFLVFFILQCQTQRKIPRQVENSNHAIVQQIQEASLKFVNSSDCSQACLKNEIQLVEHVCDVANELKDPSQTEAVIEIVDSFRADPNLGKELIETVLTNINSNPTPFTDKQIAGISMMAASGLAFGGGGVLAIYNYIQSKRPGILLEPEYQIVDNFIKSTFTNGGIEVNPSIREKAIATMKGIEKNKRGAVSSIDTDLKSIPSFNEKIQYLEFLSVGLDFENKDGVPDEILEN